jgi:uncharacterized protein
MNAPARTLSTPWYREPWPWLLMLGPFLVVLAGLYTGWLAFDTSDGLVDDDYYKQGLAVNQRIHRDQHALARGINAKVQLAANGRDIALAFGERDAGAAAPAALMVRLSHPTVAGRDISIVLPLGPDGVYRASLADRLTGRWLVLLEDATATWRLGGDWSPEIDPALHLTPRGEVPKGDASKKGD